MKTFAVVVLYKQRISQCKTILSLLENHKKSPGAFDAFKLLIFDNSPEAQPLDLPIPFAHEYFSNPKNEGLGVAYNHAFKQASAGGFDWLLLLDQDSALPDSYLEKLATDVAIAGTHEAIAAFVPKMRYENEYFSPSKVLLGGAHRPIDMRTQGVYSGRICAIGSCSLVRVAFLESIGGFNQFFWIDGLDRWLFQVIEDRGRKVFVSDLTIEHELSVLDYDRFMNPKRYLNIIEFETYFMMFYKSWLDNFIYVLRLLRRAAALSLNPKTAPYSVITLKHLKNVVASFAVKRAFDILVVLLVLIPLLPILAMVAFAVRLTSSGPSLYWSRRVGRNNTIFKMPKFRTMHTKTPAVATHLLANPDQYLTPIGSFLRKTSLDELPQLLSILLGDMSFVGPRPALYNQDDLIALRTAKNIHTLVPGLTGWAQINGRDELPIPVKVELDEYYLKNRSLFLDLKIMVMTALKVLRAEGVTH